MSLGALPQLTVNGLFVGSLYAMLALSWGLIFSTTTVFHFAHALTVTLGAYLTLLAAQAGLPLAVAFLLASLGAGIFGFLNDLLLYKPLRNRGALQLNVFLASLGFLIAGEAVIQFIFGPNAQSIPGFLPTGVLLGPVAFSTLHVLIAAVSWTLIVLVAGFLRWSKYGLAVRAVESNPPLADAFGMDRQRIFSLVFLLGSFMAGTAGGLLALLEAATPTMGVVPLLAAFVAVFIGGIGSVAGAVVGGVLLGLLQNLGGIFLPGHLQGIVAFVLLFLVLIWRPSGLFARGQA